MGPSLDHPATVFTEDYKELEARDVLVGYTDGFGEGPAIRDKIRQLVSAALEETPPKSLQQIADQVLKEALEWQPPEDRDDATVLLIRVKS